MSAGALPLLKILFLLGFCLHNAEEAVWLPAWSKRAGRFHETVKPAAFIFAVIVVTTEGILLAALDLLFGDGVPFLRYAFLGFVGMMGLNALFQHLGATILLKRYAPGLLTGLLLNLPLAVAILWLALQGGAEAGLVAVGVAVVSALTLLSLRPLFRLGESWLGDL